MNQYQKLEDIYRKSHITYLIMFRESSDSSKPYNPIIGISPENRQELLVQGSHLFDPDLKAILPAVRYVMHLPRIGFDAIDVGPDMVLNSHDTPHDILIIPSSASQMFSAVAIPGHVLLVYEDSCELEVEYFKEHALIDIVPISKLSSTLLLEHWNIIASLMKPLNDEDCLPLHMEILEDDRILSLSPFFVLNHLQKSNVLFELNSTGVDLFTDVYSICMGMHSLVEQINKLYENPSADKKQLEEKYDSATKIPVIVTMLGKPMYQKRLTNVSPYVADEEREVSRIMAVHRACAKDGVVAELGDVPSELFVLLEQLEEHCKSRKVSNSCVWSTLRKMGKLFSDYLPVEVGACMVRASHVTAFTDFPIGLAILPSGEAPLCCYNSISYRPVTPMTRAFQLEMQKAPQHYIGKHCKIVIAECLAPDDRIRKISEGAWSWFASESTKTEGLSIVLEEVLSVNALKQLMKENSDADILVISAHGAYKKDANLAGLCIGDDVWFGNENDVRMPPLVMLSACHVSPRGSGSVNVADLLLRAGACAVLGAFIPVDVRKNSMLFIRFFSYIQAALEGNKSYKTALDAWTGVVATNAVNEIVNDSPQLLSWYMSPNRSGLRRMEDFMMNRCKGRLTRSNIYNDTIQVLREMTGEDGIGDLFDSVMKSQGFFPESLFYQMIGFPENIILYHPAYNAAI